MKGEKSETETWRDIGVQRFRREASGGPLDLLLVARRNVETGATRIEMLIPNAERLSLGEDFGVVIQCFGWAMASLGIEAALMPPEAWHDCCQVIQKVEYEFRLD